METKDKEKPARPARRRPDRAGSAAGTKTGAPASRRPSSERSASQPEAGKRPAASQTGARKRTAAAPQSGAQRRTGAAPRRPAPANRGRGKDIPGESGYKPYQKANTQRRKTRKQNLAKTLTTFFSYQNPILQRINHVESDVFGDAVSRQKKKAAQEARRRKRAAELNTPAIIYTQPMAFNRNRLIIQLMTILAVVLALVMGMSVFFKVKTITVSGANVYSAWTIREKSGITEGDNLLTFGRTKASGQIIANLPYVKSARIGIKLPDTVNIEIEEAAVVYAIQDNDAVWWLINSDGKVVEQTNVANSKNYTRVLGVTLTQPQPGSQGIASEIVTESEEEAEETTVPTIAVEGEVMPQELITGALRFNAALHILQALEANDIVGSATSVDVSRLEDIILWYGTQYQVNLGDTANMDYKIACMNDVILQMSDYQTGILDISFTTWPDQVGYTPFG